MPVLDADLVAVLVLALSGVLVLVLAAVVVQGLRLRRLRRELVRAVGDSGDDVLEVLARHEDDLGGIRGRLAGLDAATLELRELLRATVSRVGLVRYDAFDDMGGALSFSAALLDERGDGLVISAINGRTETRCYSKTVVGGRSEHNLSEEEVAAIASAIDGPTLSTIPPDGRRRRRRAS